MVSLQEEVRKNFQSGAALRCPPHITLHMPFKLRSRKLEGFKDHLHKLFSIHDEFPIKLKDFSAFEPRVIYIDVLPNESLRKLQRDLHDHLRHWNLSDSTYGDRGFVPHVTIAFRDLRRAKFKQAWSQYEHDQFKASCIVKEVCLLQHDGQRWQIHHRFQLNF